MILELAILNIKPGQELRFEAAFVKASEIIRQARGYCGHELQRSIEHRDRYLLLVRWERLEDHTVGFRQSKDYLEWKALLHHFYDPFPRVEHYETITGYVP